MGKQPIAGWYIREYRCANGICEKTKFFVPDGKLPAYSVRERKRQIRRAEKNVTEAKHIAARIVNHNFRAGADEYVTDTFDDAGMAQLVMKAGTDDRDALLLAAQHEAELQMRRARYACRKAGITLRYLFVKSDLDGKTLEPVRPHIHIIVNREAAQIVAGAWKLGKAVHSTLYSRHHGDLTDLVEYMIAQTRQIGTEKRYTPSRNLEQPPMTEPRPVKSIDAPLRVPPGCKFIWRSEQRTGRPQKLRYYRPPRARKRAIGTDTDGDEEGASI